MSNQRSQGYRQGVLTPLAVKYGACVNGTVERCRTVEVPGDGIIDVLDFVPCQSSHRHNWIIRRN
jgi:hypothetical protein